MKIYISILRGINVSGQKIIKMDALRNTYERLGFNNVTSYVQSGNVIFSGEEFKHKDLEQKLSRQILKDFGFDVPVLVLDIEKLKKTIEENPFSGDPDKDPSCLHVTFLSSYPDAYDQKIIDEKKQNGEELAYSNDAIYLYCPTGYGKTKLNNNFIETKLKVSATTRNWKTTNELYKIAKQII